MEATIYRRVYGVDFSGTKDAGKRIWIASGVIEEDALRVEKCCRADSLPGSGRRREHCLKTLRDFIGSENKCVFGLDFPPTPLSPDLLRDSRCALPVGAGPTGMCAPHAERAAGQGVDSENLSGLDVKAGESLLAALQARY